MSDRGKTCNASALQKYELYKNSIVPLLQVPWSPLSKGFKGFKGSNKGTFI